jgi:hypothetical protein
MANPTALSGEKPMRIIPKLSVEKAIKKFTTQQKLEFDAALREIIQNPLVGENKRGDLAGIKVYKFKMNQQLTLVAYHCNESLDTLWLLKIGLLENFYRDLKH